MFAVARIAIAIGLAGLAPFVLGVIGVIALPEYRALLTGYFYLYSAGILAFMAGIYWPLSMQIEQRCYPLSPLSTILVSQAFFVAAGVGLLLPTLYQVVVYTTAYTALCVVDLRWMKSYWPAWYRRLRLQLTLVVVNCQLLMGGWLLLAP